MAETANIGEIAAKISKEIFKHFLWQTHPKRDDNFECSNANHRREGGTQKLTHPGDVVFFYDDPYLGKRVYLHTDLKSYAANSISAPRLRKALQNLCMTVECAKESFDWRAKYSVDTNSAHEVRGMLFVHNHDQSYAKIFGDTISKINLQALPVAPGTVIHFIGPSDINRLYSIGNDIIRLRGEGDLPADYTFYYPDMVLFRRHGDIWGQAATIESLTGPYLILKYGSGQESKKGYVIYYNRSGSSVDEFEYFIDSLSRYQLLEPGETILIRVADPEPDPQMKSHFLAAKSRYVRAWGFDPAREAILDKIEIDTVTSVTSTYNPGTVGWRE